jgi:rhodanese-related sulfurtransferase
MTIPQLSVQELKNRLDSEDIPLLVDCRNDDERQYCQIEPSLFIPLPEMISRVQEVEPTDGQMVVVYCHHGVRSLRGAAILLNSGISNVYSLAGGIDAWSVMIDPKVRRY